MLHRFKSAVLDAGSPGVVGPNAWNDEHVQGIVSLAVNTSLATTYDTILASGSATLTLPDATACTGQPYLFQDMDGSTITIATVSAQTIGGNATATLTTINQTLSIFSNGTNWSIATGPGAGGVGLPGALPQTGSYTFYVSGGTTYAHNNLTGNVDYSGADAGVVVNSVLNANATVGGRLFFKNGIYNINSMTLETATGGSNFNGSGNALAYGIGIPANTLGGTPASVQWIFEGEATSVWLGESDATTINNNGVIFSITPTAVASVAAGSVLAGVWSRPAASCALNYASIFANVTNDVRFRNITVRFPTNTRGNEIGFASYFYINVAYENCVADFNLSYHAINIGALPAVGSYNSIGITSTVSGSGNWQHFDDCYATGFNIGFDIQSELVVADGLNTVYCTTAGIIGRSSTAVYHPIVMLHIVDQECPNGWVLGANMQAGTRVDFYSYDMETAASGTWARLQNLVETHAGNTTGFINYVIVQQGVGIVSPPPLPFSAGGTQYTISSSAGLISGSPLTVTSATAPGLSEVSAQLATDNFTRTAENPLSDGGKWTEQTGSGGTLKTTGTQVEAVTASTLSFYYWNNISPWANNQYSEMTVGTLTGANYLIPSVRMDTATNSGYMLEVEGTGNVFIVSFASAVQTPLANISGLTINSGDVFRLSAAGSTLRAYQNGKLLLQATDSTYAAGAAGIGIYAPTIANATSSLWAGGVLQALTFGATTAAAASAGGNGDVPAQVAGYLNWNLNGTSIKVPYYAA
jgi:hypothetical protein